VLLLDRSIMSKRRKKKRGKTKSRAAFEARLDSLAATIEAPPWHVVEIPVHASHASHATLASHVATPSDASRVAMAAAPKGPPTSRTLIMLGPATSPSKGHEREDAPAVNAVYRSALDRETPARRTNGVSDLAIVRGAPERPMAPRPPAAGRTSSASRADRAERRRAATPRSPAPARPSGAGGESRRGKSLEERAASYERAFRAWSHRAFGGADATTVERGATYDVYVYAPRTGRKPSDSVRRTVPPAPRSPVGWMLVAAAAFFSAAVALMTVSVVVFGNDEAPPITPIAHASAKTEVATTGSTLALTSGSYGPRDITPPSEASTSPAVASATPSTATQSTPSVAHDPDRFAFAPKRIAGRRPAR
jgi:hypothetical protein